MIKWLRQRSSLHQRRSYITVCLAACGSSQMEGYNYQTNGWHKRIKHNLRCNTPQIKKRESKPSLSPCLLICKWNNPLNVSNSQGHVINNTWFGGEMSSTGQINLLHNTRSTAFFRGQLRQNPGKVLMYLPNAF